MKPGSRIPTALIFDGQFANNIENLWGYKEVLIAGPKDYVKYTDQFQTRSHINFDDGPLPLKPSPGRNLPHICAGPLLKNVAHGWTTQPPSIFTPMSMT
ncbi:membrane-bound lytic murein transglycosylase C [Salmonella enterica subsp. enterica]|uniref:Membrane-bound lytic murein transglycosylase C n=1 Tax=Salmonella enterica I TaxID=59201 RepID=A0A379WLR5_SALET|nr:membrane-bound lytic murein transglycosylase C [Salmonella enterica subsp. enterica]